MARQYDQTVGNVFDPYDDVPREVRGAGRIRQSGLQRLLAQLPQAALEIAENIGGNIQAKNELDFRKEQARIADERYNKEQNELKKERDYIRSRQIRLDKDNKNLQNLKLTLNALEPHQALQYLVKHNDIEGVDSSDLRLIQKETEEFNSSLKPIIDIAPAGNIKTINKSLLDINTFVEENQDNPLFQVNSSAYGKVIDKRNKLITRLNQVSSDGYVDPKYWTQVDPTKGKVAKELYDKSIETVSALSDQKAITNDLSDQKALDVRIQKEFADQEAIRRGFKLDSISDIKKKETENMALSKLDALMQMNPAGAQSMASAVSSIPSDIIPEETAITDSEMADVSNQISTLTEVENNLNKINEGIPGIGSDETDLAETESTTEIGGGTSVLPDVLRTTQVGAGSDVVDKVDSGQFDAIDMLSGANNQKTKTQEEIDNEFLESQGLLDSETGDSLKSVSEIKRLKHRNVPAAFADDLGRGRNTLVKKLFNLMDEYDKTDPSKNSRRLNKLSSSMNQLSDKISTKLKGFINPKTGNFSDANYTAKFYNRLSDVTGVSVEKLKDTIKSIIS